MKIKHVDDYVEILKMMYPTVDEKDILRIIKFGWRQYYLLCSIGGFINIYDKSGFWQFAGFMYKNVAQFAKMYARKLTLRLRTLFVRKKLKWDGYYYFGIAECDAENYEKQIKKAGRPRKKFNYGNVILYKLQDECFAHSIWYKYIFRVPYVSDFGYKLVMKDFVSDRAELIKTQEPKLLNGILVDNNNYQILK